MSEDHLDTAGSESNKDQNMTSNIRRSGRNKVPSTLYSEHVQDLPRNSRKTTKGGAQNQKSTESMTIKSENIEDIETKEEYNEKLEVAASQVSKKNSETHFSQTDWLPFTLDDKNEIIENENDRMEEEGRKPMWVSFIVEDTDSNDSMHDSAKDNETSSYNNGTGYSTRKNRKKKKYSDEMHFLYGTEKQLIPKPKSKANKKQQKSSAAKTATPVAQKSPERTHNNTNDILLMLYNAAMNVRKEEKDKPSPVSMGQQIGQQNQIKIESHQTPSQSQAKESKLKDEFEFLEEMKRKTKITKGQSIPKINNNIHEEIPMMPLRREDERIHYIKKAIKQEGKLIFQHFNNKITEIDLVCNKLRPNYESMKSSKILEAINIDEKLGDENKENEPIDSNSSRVVRTSENSPPPGGESMIQEVQSAPLDEVSILRLKMQKLKKMGEEIKSHIKPSILSYN